APGDTLFVFDDPYDLYLHADMAPVSRTVYQLTPNAEVTAQWNAALERQPTFITISLGTEAMMWQKTNGPEARLAALLGGASHVAIADSPIAIVYRRTRASTLPLPPWVFAPPPDVADHPPDDANECSAVDARPSPPIITRRGVQWPGMRRPLSA